MLCLTHTKFLAGSFFAEFLGAGGAFNRWVQGYPLSYTSPTASEKRDVLGILAGVRGDAVAAQALGLKRLVIEDSVRRALKGAYPLGPRLR